MWRAWMWKPQLPLRRIAKSNNERMCQGNVEVTAAHPFVLCDSHIDYFLLAENNELNV